MKRTIMLFAALGVALCGEFALAAGDNADIRALTFNMPNDPAENLPKQGKFVSLAFAELDGNQGRTLGKDGHISVWQTEGREPYVYVVSINPVTGGADIHTVTKGADGLMRIEASEDAPAAKNALAQAGLAWVKVTNVSDKRPKF